MIDEKKHADFVDTLTGLSHPTARCVDGPWKHQVLPIGGGHPRQEFIPGERVWVVDTPTKIPPFFIVSFTPPELTAPQSSPGFYTLNPERTEWVWYADLILPTSLIA